MGRRQRDLIDLPEEGFEGRILLIRKERGSIDRKEEAFEDLMLVGMMERSLIGLQEVDIKELMQEDMKVRSLIDLQEVDFEDLKQPNQEMNFLVESKTEIREMRRPLVKSHLKTSSSTINKMKKLEVLNLNRRATHCFSTAKEEWDSKKQPRTQ